MAADEAKRAGERRRASCQGRVKGGSGVERIALVVDRFMAWLYGQGDVRRGAVLGVAFGLLLVVVVLLACVILNLVISPR